MTAAGLTVWVTGPDPAALEAMADEIAAALAARHLAVETVDGRTPGLAALADPPSAAALVAGLLARHGVAAVVALPAPRAVRDRARAEIGRLIEVHVVPPGGSHASGHEAPERAEVEVVVPEPSPGAGSERTLRTLELLDLIPRGEDPGYSEEEEREVIRRLKAFGYL